ncbi:MAG: ferredoxin [Lachnospiraceae bacterium]|jgi:uncharacterized ferredoxin-like protein|nr:ferredoxin [Lachnospiraceae bacterium]
MMIHSNQAEDTSILAAAQAMCLAARTAPKAKGMDCICTAILTGEEKEALAKEMDRIAQEQNMAFFQRDAQNVRAASAIVLIGSVNKVRGLNTTCQFCGFQDCGTCTAQGGRCAYTAMDLGIAIGSAVSTAADRRADNRVLFSAGRAAMNLKLLGEDICQAVGIPLSASGKSPFFDR